MNKESLRILFDNSFLKVFHFTVALHYLYAFYYDWTYVLPEEVKLRKYTFGGKLVYLTVLNVVSIFISLSKILFHFFKINI
jgi:hypothetical protein